MNHHMKQALRPVLLVAALVAAGALNLAAQGTCSGREPVGWLGISAVSCTNCYFSYPGEGQPTLFATEPRVTGLAANSPAASALRTGDILVSIDDHLITTFAGGRRLANLKPGESVELVVRRNGELLTHRFANLPSICPYDARVLGSRVGARGGARSGGISPGSSGGTSARSGRAVGVAPGAVVAQALPGRVFSAGLLPRVSFGFGITCSSCAPRPDGDNTVVWRFREYPEIYSVESQSQAFRAGIRRGDLLTHIDHVDITSEEGGRRFGQVQAGQNVRFTFQRGSSITTRELRAETRRGVSTFALTPTREPETENSLMAARQLIERIRVQENLTRDQLAQLVQQQDGKLQELVQKLNQQSSEQRRRLEELYSQLAQLDVPARAKIAPKPPTPPVAASADRNTSRYSGKLGETDIEVRGPTGVYVERTDDEIIIYVGESTIRLKRSGIR